MTPDDKCGVNGIGFAANRRHPSYKIVPSHSRQARAECAQHPLVHSFHCHQVLVVRRANRVDSPELAHQCLFQLWPDARNIVEKAQTAGCEKVLITERGVSFGYNNLVVDMRSFPIMAEFGVPVVFDVTHSLQLPGGLGHATGGLSEYIEPLARAGVACGVDAVFMEVHDAPERAPSDGPNMLPLTRMGALLETLREVHALVKEQARAAKS